MLSSVTSAAGHGGSTLRIERVSKRHGAVEALAGLSLSVGAGECVALVGESGSGKTTLLRCVNRLTEPDSGTILIDNADVRSRDPVALRRSIGYVPQEGGLLPHWSVARNVALVPWLSGMTDVSARVEQAMRSVGLESADLGARWPHELSGGQRQRVAIARALAAGQSLLLLDEPFGALDAITRATLQQEFARLRQSAGFSAILVTHDLGEALALADRIAVLRSGRLEQIADAETLRHAPATEYVAELLRHALGGRAQ